MSSEKMREEFEFWYLDAMVELLGDGIRDQVQKNIAWKREDGSYGDPALRLALMAWQASRAALVVDLPYPGSDYDYSDSQVNGACKHHGKAVKAIKALGLKVEM